MRSGYGDQHLGLRQEKVWIPILLSAISGMVDVTGYLTLGMFTAHITGNFVIVAALLVRGGRVNPDQILAIPVFMIAVAGTWLIAEASGRSGSQLDAAASPDSVSADHRCVDFQYHHANRLPTLMA